MNDLQDTIRSYEYLMRIHTDDGFKLGKGYVATLQDTP